MTKVERPAHCAGSKACNQKAHPLRVCESCATVEATENGLRNTPLCHAPKSSTLPIPDEFTGLNMFDSQFGERQCVLPT